MGAILRNLVLTVIFQTFFSYPLQAQGLELVETYSGHLAPKSVVHNGHGLFFAQNMMYEHSITAYERGVGLIKTIQDSVDLSAYGYRRFCETVQGAPCEAAVSHSGAFLWVANYAMYGKGFEKEADDECTPNGQFDSSFIFKISTRDFSIQNIIQVGCVPKFLNVYRDSLLLVSNWCSGEVSVVSLATEKVVRHYSMKMYPRGIAFDPKQKTAYIAQMGTYEIAKVNLETHKVDSIVVPGRSPRHLCIDTKSDLLYASLNGAGRVVKINLETDKTEVSVATGRAPRSMTLSADGTYLYVVNYGDNTFSKVRTSDFAVLETQTTKGKPIGICFDDSTKNVWVACYEGYIQVFHDKFFGADSLYQSFTTKGYGLVTGSFVEKENAIHHLAFCNAQGVDAHIKESEGKFRVVVCGYSSIAEAMAAMAGNPVLEKAWVIECGLDN